MKSYLKKFVTIQPTKNTKHTNVLFFNRKAIKYS